MTKENLRDIATRAFKTFWQAAVSYIIINSEVFFTDITSFDLDKLKQFGLAIGIGALSAGLSALYNAVLRPLVNGK